MTARAIKHSDVMTKEIFDRIEGKVVQEIDANLSVSYTEALQKMRLKRENGE